MIVHKKELAHVQTNYIGLIEVNVLGGRAFICLMHAVYASVYACTGQEKNNLFRVGYVYVRDTRLCINRLYDVRRHCIGYIHLKWNHMASAEEPPSSADAIYVEAQTPNWK